MILLLASLLILWFALSRSKTVRQLDARTLEWLFKLGGAVFVLLSAVVVLLRGHVEIALILVGGGIWLYNIAGKSSPGAAPPKAASQGPSRVRSAIIEMVLDPATGMMGGLVLAGPDEGRRLDQMTRPQCEALYRLCESADRDGARLLEAYFDRRFAGWRQARQRDDDAGRDRARRAGRMSEEEAYEVLGLARGATRDEVTRSHRSLMKKLHPDQGGSTALAARVNEAKEILMRRHL